MSNFWLWMWGFPKCNKGGRCNADNDRSTWGIGPISGNYMKFYKYHCSKCGRDTSDYGKI